MGLFVRFRAPLIFLATCIACISLHETGHAVAGIATGGTVTQFVLLTARPHVRIQGPSSEVQRAARAGAGSAMLVTVWLLGMALVRPPRASMVAAASGLVVFVEGCGWLISSVIYPWGPGDDAWRFLAHSGANPWVIAAGAGLIVLAGGSTFLRHIRPDPVAETAPPKAAAARA